MNRKRVIIIDDGVASEAILIEKGNLLEKYIVQQNKMMKLESYVDENVFSHGSICAKIITKNLNDVIITSIKILNDDDIGEFSSLICALNWCIESADNIYAVNISAGIDDFCKRSINELCYKLFKRDVIVFAALSNNSYDYSLPAVSPYTISVQQSISEKMRKKELWKADAQCSGRIEIEQDGISFFSEACNSYACANYVGEYLSGNLSDDYERPFLYDFSMLYDICIYTEKKKITCESTMLDFVEYDIKNISNETNLILLCRKRGCNRIINELIDKRINPRCIFWCGNKAPRILKQYCYSSKVLLWERDILKHRVNRHCSIDEPIVYLKGNLKLVIRACTHLKNSFENEGYRVIICSSEKNAYIYGFWYAKNFADLGYLNYSLKADIIFLTGKAIKNFHKCDITLSCKENNIEVGNGKKKTISSYEQLFKNVKKCFFETSYEKPNPN